MNSQPNRIPVRLYDQEEPVLWSDVMPLAPVIIAGNRVTRQLVKAADRLNERLRRIEAAERARHRMPR